MQQRTSAVGHRSNLILIGVITLHLLLGCLYAGRTYFAHFNDAVPMFPAGGTGEPQLMQPGDQFEQFYRYNLLYANLHHHHAPFYSGYEYNLSPHSPAFSEGALFFPFNFLQLILAPLFGQIAAYNLISILSFAGVGGAMFLLLREITGRTSAALLGSLILSLLPHRTSFIFGEMVFGVDLLWAPLIVLTFERYLGTLRPKYCIAFGLLFFFYATSNIQGFYLFALFSLPYFVIRTISTAWSNRWDPPRLLKITLTTAAALLPVAIYVALMFKVLVTSGNQNGHAYDEVRLYSPSAADMFRTWSGNEKSVSLGWPLAILLAMGFVLLLIPRRKTDSAVCLPPLLIPAVLLTLVVSYLFCFGTTLDETTGSKIYRFYFDHIPGGSGTRTPGRLMGTAGFYFAYLFGLMWAQLAAVWPARAPARTLGAILTGLCAVIIARGNFYGHPILTRFVSGNSAYAQIAGHPGVVYTIPLQPEADHYLNATYLYFAQKYNLRLFGGHSSFYPRQWQNSAPPLAAVNGGRFDREMARRFQAAGIDRLAVHVTTYRPQTSLFTLARLKQSPFLHLLAEDAGVSIFRIDPDAPGEQILSPASILGTSNPVETDTVQYVDGWHQLEAYPSQRSFRWTSGIHADAVYFPKKHIPNTLRIVYMMPGGDLRVQINGTEMKLEPKPLAGRWQEAVVDLHRLTDANYFYVELISPSIYRSPPDTREFGCQVSELVFE